MMPTINALERKIENLENHIDETAVRSKVLLLIPDNGRLLSGCGCGRSSTGFCDLIVYDENHPPEMYMTQEEIANQKPLR